MHVANKLSMQIKSHDYPNIKHPTNGAYYFGITGIAVNQQRVPTPPGAFDFDVGSGTGGAVFSTVTPYTVLRPEIYGPLHDAFDEATSGIPLANPVVCYPASAHATTRQGYDVAGIDLMLDGGRNWTLYGGSSLVLVNDQTACFAFVPMTTSMPAVADSPAVIVGGFQMGNRLIMFDLAKEMFGFSGLLSGMGTSCTNFNFTMETS